MSKALTRKMLQDNNIMVFVNEAGDPEIWEYGKRKHFCKEGWYRRYPPIRLTKHPYGKTMRYQSIELSWYGKRTNLQAHRIIYAFLKGDIPEGYDVDHIDGNTLNNRRENLQLLTRKENLLKRSMTQAEIAKAYFARKREIQNEKLKD